MWAPPFPDDEPSTGRPRWKRAAEDCVSELIGALVMLRSGEADEVLDVAFVVESLCEAMTRLFEAQRLDVEPTSSLRAAVVSLDQALAPVRLLQEPALQALRTGLEAGRAAALEAVDASISVVWSSPASVEELRASTTSLRLHGRLTPPVVPHFAVLPPPPPDVTETPEPFDPPANVEELKAAIEALRQRADARAAKKQEASKEEGEEATPEVELDPTRLFIEEQARICFEDLAMLCTQRAPQLGEAWRSVEVLEERLRACVDAIAALGRPALQCIQDQVLEAPAFDPARILAFTVLCGAFDGADSLALAEWAFEVLLRAYPEEEDALHRSFAEGLGLVPHPDVGSLCERWLRSESLRRRATALEVLNWRREASEEQLRAALVDEPEVAALALPALVVRRPIDARELIDDALRRGGSHLRVAAWRSMCLLGDPRLGPLLATELGSAEKDEAARILGIHAERRDAELLLAEASAAPTPALAEALGFAGLTDAVPVLIGLLERDDLELQLAAARALIRITGEELWEEIRLSPDRVAGDPPPPPGSALQTAQDPRDAADPGSDDFIELPTLRAPPWREYWSAYGPNFDPNRRYRRGWPHEPTILVEDLLHQRAPREERQLMILEVIARLGRDVRLDVRDWVHDQCAVLEQLRETVGTSAGAGSWALPRHR